MTTERPTEIQQSNEWKAHARELQEKVDILLEGPDAIKMYSRFKTHADKIKGAFPDYVDYLAFHILAGSTPDPERPPNKLDFPEQYSIKSFLNKIQAET